MLFWLACEELKTECNKHTIDEKARTIYEDYISILSPKEVRGTNAPGRFGPLLWLRGGLGWGGGFLGRGHPGAQGVGVPEGCSQRYVPIPNGTASGGCLCTATSPSHVPVPEAPRVAAPGLCCGAETSRGHHRAEEMRLRGIPQPRSLRTARGHGSGLLLLPYGRSGANPAEPRPHPSFGTPFSAPRLIAEPPPLAVAPPGPDAPLSSAGRPSSRPCRAVPGVGGSSPGSHSPHFSPR